MPATTALRKGGWTSAQRKNLSAIRYPHASDPADFVLSREASWKALVEIKVAEGDPPKAIDPATELKRVKQLYGYHQAPPSYFDEPTKALLGFWMGTDPAATVAMMARSGKEDGRDYLEGQEWRSWPQLKRYLFALDEETFGKLRAGIEPTYRKLVESKDWNERKRGLWLIYAFSRNPEWAHEYAKSHPDYVEDVVFASLTDPDLALKHSEKVSTTLVRWWVLDVVENLGRAAAPALEKLVARARRADERKPIEAAMKIALKLEDAPAADAMPTEAPAKAKAKAAASAGDSPALPASLTDPFAAPKAAPKKKAAPASNAPKPPPETLTLTLSAERRKELEDQEKARPHDDASALSSLELHARDLKLHVWYALRELERLAPAQRFTWLRGLNDEQRALVMRDRNGFAPEAFVSLVAFAAKGEQERALTIALALLATPERIAELAKSMHSPSIIARLAEVSAGKKKAAADAAKGWLTSHAAEAIAALVPAAAAAFGKAREPLTAALDLLRAAGHSAAIDAAGGAGLAAEPTVLKAPRTLPPFFLMAKLPALALKAGGEIPADVVTKIGQMLAVSPVDAPMEGLKALVQLTTDESRHAFAWALLEAWQGKGAPAQDRWPVEWLGFLAGESVSEKLAELSLQWARAGQHQRAFWAVDVLSRLGTDRAARALVELEADSPFQGLDARCQGALEAIAGQRGLSEDELRDELVPDLGVAPGKPLAIEDAGQRFEIVLRAGLQLTVRTGGSELTEPPKKAARARETYSGLKATARRQARQAGRRFERAMTARRRWTGERFRTGLLGRPVLASLAQSLVWGTYDAQGRLQQAFRVDESLGLAGVDDSALPELDAKASVGVVHPIELAGDLPRWTKLFLDYAIAQPFDQLGRAVADVEGLGRECRQLQGVQVTTGRLVGLRRRGWLRGPAGDNGIVETLVRECQGASGGKAFQAVLRFSPGFAIVATDYDEKQTLEALDAPMGELSPVSVSELVLDLAALRAT